VLPLSFDPKEALEAVWQAFSLANYSYTLYKTSKIKELYPLSQVCWVGISLVPDATIQAIDRLSSSTSWARDLVNGNADFVTPSYLVKMAESMVNLAPDKVRVEIWDQKKLSEVGMHLLLAVSRGSPEPPYFIQLSYAGAPHRSERVVLVGKGVTYDTGGLSLKPTANMLDMKCDMAGAATVLGAFRAAVEARLPLNLSVLVPSAENSIDGKSYKLGDVYTSYSGKTVEINNTDAEGRLILADALAFACKTLDPTWMIDVATLTGGALVALGDEMAPFFTDHKGLQQALEQASSSTGELLWHMPLHAPYKKAFKADYGDLTNSGGSMASSMKGALFLQEFVERRTAWAHIDIAGPAFLDAPRYYWGTRGTGFCIRLLYRWMETLG
jgi:leucyl aminopeptidase